MIHDTWYIHLSICYIDVRLSICYIYPYFNSFCVLVLVFRTGMLPSLILIQNRRSVAEIIPLEGRSKGLSEACGDDGV